MTIANLIPAHRSDSRKRRIRIRRWGALCASYGVLLVVCYASCHVLWGTKNEGLAAELAATSTKISNTRLSIVSLQKQLRSAQLELEANRAVGNQPDWSVLLTTLARNLGDEVFLSGWTLAPVKSETDSSGTPSRGEKPSGGKRLVAAGQRQYVLRLTGYGRSFGAVSALVLRLENHVLFDEVKTIKTFREQLLSGTVIAFELDCQLGRDRRKSG